MPTHEDNWRAAMQGDFAPLVASWVHCSPQQRAAIDAVLALVSADRKPPTLARAASSGDALRFLAIDAVLRCDAAALTDIASAQHGEDASRTRRWASLMHGQVADTTIGHGDSRAGRGVENAVLSALESAHAGNEPEAISHSRRAVRMARADGLVLFELLASIVLARCRRLEGRPHLALRILTSVAAVAPPPWRGWMAYERAMAGGDRAELGVNFPPSSVLKSVWRACETGDPGMVLGVQAPAFCAHELALFRESHLADEPPSAPTRDWIFARDSDPPACLSGLCVPEIDTSGERAPVCLLVRPGQPARRVFAEAALLCADATRPPSFELAQSRTWSAIAELATSPTQQRPELFERVYGFAFLPARHAGTLRVLLHRVRQTLPAGLELDELDTLRVSHPVLLPDPRVRVDMETLILGQLARASGRASANAIAEALGVSSRTVQQTLRELIDDGTCTAEREGRRIHYVLEDTTLSEPTLSRLHPRGVPEM